MTIQDIIKQADFKFVAKKEADRHCYMYGKEFSEEKISRIEENMKHFVEMLGALKVKKNNCIMVPDFYWEDGKRSTISAYREKTDFEKVIHRITEDRAKWEALANTNIDTNLSYETYKKMMYEYEDVFIQSYGIEFSVWEDILGAEVIDFFPEGLNKDEFIEDILEELSFNGLTREQQDERRKELDDSIQELEEIRKLPEKEQEKHLKTLDLDRLWEDLGIERESEEERQESQRLMMLDCVRNKQDSLKVLLAVAGKYAGEGTNEL